MKIVYQDRKQRGNIDNHIITEKPQFSFQYEYLLVDDEVAEYTPRDAANYPDLTITREDMEAYYVNRPLTPEQKQEVIDYYNAWTPPIQPEPEPPTLAEVQSRKVREINSAYENELNVILKDYPDVETKTWDKQEQEARAWVADNTVSTPLLTEIATARGMTLAELVPRVIAKADAWMQLSGAATGKRQKLESDIDAATTVEAVEATQW